MSRGEENTGGCEENTGGCEENTGGCEENTGGSGSTRACAAHDNLNNIPLPEY